MCIWRVGRGRRGGGHSSSNTVTEETKKRFRRAHLLILFLPQLGAPANKRNVARVEQKLLRTAASPEERSLLLTEECKSASRAARASLLPPLRGRQLPAAASPSSAATLPPCRGPYRS